MAIKTAKELAMAAEAVAKNYKTLYIMGCFGAPMNDKNKARYTKNHSYNKDATRTAMIKAASADTFGFDCVCLIKGLLWGWSGDTSKTYGGAKYASNDVPDIGADAMIKKCSDVSTDFSKIEVGEAVWKSGHIGIYIGNGLAVECTPSWDNCVQITACNCYKTGYNRRVWTKHGKLPYVTYTVEEKVEEKAEEKVEKPATTTSVEATDSAKSFLKTLAGTYKVTAKNGLNVRHGAGVTKKKMVAIPYGTKVQCYGYYSTSLGVNWLKIQFTYKGVKYTGFASSKYLEK